MTESEGIVARVDGEHVWLDVSGATGCGGCEKGGGCGLGGDSRGRRLRRVRNTAGARIGDTVVLSVPDGAVLKAALWSYLAPLALAITGAASGLTFFGGDGAAVAGAVAGLAAGGLVLKLAGNRLARGREPLLAMRVKPAVVQLHRKPAS